MLNASGQTDTGKKRTANQDAIFLSSKPIGPLPNLFIIADGMGGHKGGEIASKAAIDSFVDFVLESEDAGAENFLDLLTSAAKYANDVVLKQAEENPELSGMGTTLTACTIANNKCILSHVGDSRAYLISQDSITQLTNDHSYVSEMMKAGQMSQSEARDHPKRNVLTRVLGTLEMNADGHIYELTPAAAVLLCSDGLFNMVAEDEIAKIVNTSDNPTESLVTAANNNGGADNISVILIKFEKR